MSARPGPCGGARPTGIPIAISRLYRRLGYLGTEDAERH
jgi:hypothetical protein